VQIYLIEVVTARRLLWGAGPLC